MGGGGDDATAQSDGGDEVNINIRTPNGSKFAARIGLGSTVRAFKEALSPECNIPPDQQRLIYKGRILKDDQTLQSYGLEADHAVHLVRGFAPSAAANTDGATNAGNANSTQARRVGSNGGALGGSGSEASPFSGLGLNVNGLGGTGGLSGSGFELEQVQQQFIQNPNVMTDIMNMPLFQNLVTNTDIVQNMIMSIPQMREIVDRHPEIGHILNDPGTLRQTLEAARNPELMREMMRNSDRAMSNIEASPEGFNMLRRMYENVEEPLLNASTMAGSADNSNPFAALLGPQGGNPTRTESTNPSTVGSDSTTSPPAPNTIPLPNPWSPTGRDGRPQTPAGHAGLSFPEFEGTLGGMQDTTSLNQVVQNPAISQLMQSFFSNPENINQVLGSDPQLRSMLDSNSFIREMMQNPEFLRQLASPETMQLFLTLQQSVVSRLGQQQQQGQQQQSTQEPGQTGGGLGSVYSMGLEMLMNMFGGLGIDSPDVPDRPNVPPEQLYAAQLSQLQEMGFFDRQENIRALMTTAGNIHAAVERLLGNSGR